eukprot:1145070-Pelagomonas_calceolata.AAC.3
MANIEREKDYGIRVRPRALRKVTSTGRHLTDQEDQEELFRQSKFSLQRKSKHRRILQQVGPNHGTCNTTVRQTHPIALSMPFDIPARIGCFWLAASYAVSATPDHVWASA